ncbi:MAG: amidase [Pirellulales bacterium]|nr:amidase [Pirellulales bacterium]
MVAGKSDLLSAARALRAGRTSPLELVEQSLERIAALEDRLQAWVSVDTIGARAAALALGQESLRGAWRGPLHGIPLGIKDIVDVAGWPTQAGSPLRASHLAAHDATIVDRLRSAGAIILGKTVTTEFASFDPPPTRNPWNLEHTPGGSSSGSAAAVAVEACAAAIGSQTGGSITRPASFCGVAGLKPTIGRVSVHGIVPLSFHLDHPGPIARHVADLALVLQVIAGPDPLDPLCSELPTDDYLAGLAHPRAPRIGLLEGFFLDVCGRAIHEGTLDAFERFRAAGAQVQRLSLPESFVEVILMHRRIMAVEAAETHHKLYPAHRGQFGPHIAALIEEGLATSAGDYTAALRHRHLFQSQLKPLLAEVDVLLTPATVTTAPGIDTTGDPRFNAPWSFAGLPTVSLPTELDDRGLPLGVQLTGRAFQEANLLAAAAWCEQVIGFPHVPQLLRNL